MNSKRVRAGQEIQVQVSIQEEKMVKMVVSHKAVRGTVWAGVPGKKPQPVYYHILCGHWSIYE